MAASGETFDPRYDARYQRGWVEGATDAAGPAVPAAAPETTTGRPADAAHDGTPELRAEPEAAMPSGVGPGPGPDARRGDERDAATEPSATADVESSAGRPDVRDDRVARIMRIALGIAWAVALAATVVGGALIWRLVAYVPGYDTVRDAEEMMLESLSYHVAPSLVTAGLLGVVVLTVIDGLRRAFSARGRAWPERGTRP